MQSSERIFCALINAALKSSVLYSIDNKTPSPMANKSKLYVPDVVFIPIYFLE